MATSVSDNIKVMVDSNCPSSINSGTSVKAKLFLLPYWFKEFISVSATLTLLSNFLHFSDSL